MTWSAGSDAGPAAGWVATLQEKLGSAELTELQVCLPAAEAHVQVRLEATPFPQALIRRLKAEVESQGAMFTELWKMTKEQRDRFRSERLTRPRGVKDLAEAAELVRAHLTAIASARPAGGSKAIIVPPPPSDAPPQRRAKRYEVQLDVEFQSELDFVQEHASNISNGGLFVKTSQRPEIDTLVEVRLTLPNGDKLESAARVVHVVNPPDGAGGIGLAFVTDDDEFQRKLDAYLASLA